MAGPKLAAPRMKTPAMPRVKKMPSGKPPTLKKSAMAPKAAPFTSKAKKFT